MLSVSSITLTNDKYRRKNSRNITVCSCFQTHLTLFISGESHFQENKVLREYKIKNCYFFKLALYWNSVLNFIFLLNTPKSETFYIFR